MRGFLVNILTSSSLQRPRQFAQVALAGMEDGVISDMASVDGSTAATASFYHSRVSFLLFTVPRIDFAGKGRTIDGMAKKQVVTITDDINGREGAETVSFAYAGQAYEIDLGEKNRAKLEKALEPFIAAGRKVNGSSPVRRPRARAATASSGPDRAVVRAWAVEHGFEVSPRGRLSKQVVEAYQQAH